jgi:homoprotocatechuate degradation regulator HpaR
MSNDPHLPDGGDSQILPATGRSLPIALLRARERIMGPFRELLAESGVTEQQWRVLRVLDEAGPQDATQIARNACLLMPSLSRILTTLITKGYVTRRRSADDGRRAVIAISQAGRGLLENNRERSLAIANRLEQAMGRERLDELLDLLNELDRLEL